MEHGVRLLCLVTRDRESVLGASTVEAAISRRENPGLDALALERPLHLFETH